MAKEEKPLEYQHRIRDTKGVAQRIDLDYLKRPSLLTLLRRRLTWLLLACAVLGCVPLVLGLGSSRRAVSNGPVSTSHTMFDQRCEACHTQAFNGVPDEACGKCHDGAPHPAKSVDAAKANSTPRCAQCHMEHRGKVRLSEVANGNCTSCHANLAANAAGVKIKGVEISSFRQGSHPEFSTVSLKDARPLRLNHAIHMPVQPKMLRGIRLPMKCVDCHVTDRKSPTGALLPVTFEQNCKTCHARELEFDVDHVLGDAAMPAPHTKDANTIRQFIWNQYRDTLAASPALLQKPLGNDLVLQPNSTEWLDRVTKDSLGYLFERKCVYCHQMESYAVVKKVEPIAGRYPESTPWLERTEFAHRSHRAVECESCHVSARTSRSTEDVLIPKMATCLPCHGESRAGLDRCSECHLYHNRSLEKNGNRRPTEDLRGAGFQPAMPAFLPAYLITHPGGPQ